MTEPPYEEADFGQEADQIRNAFAKLFPDLPPLGPDLMPTAQIDGFTHTIIANKDGTFSLNTLYDGDAVWGWPASLDAVLALLFTISKSLDQYANERLAHTKIEDARAPVVSPREAITGKRQDPTEQSTHYTKPRD